MRRIFGGHTDAYWAQMERKVATRGYNLDGIRHERKPRSVTYQYIVSVLS